MFQDILYGSKHIKNEETCISAPDSSHMRPEHSHGAWRLVLLSHMRLSMKKWARTELCYF